jgi:hypothetical protein
MSPAKFLGHAELDRLRVAFFSLKMANAVA